MAKVCNAGLNVEVVRAAMQARELGPVEVSRLAGKGDNWLTVRLKEGSIKAGDIQHLATALNVDPERLKAPRRSERNRQLDIFAGSELSEEQIERIADKVAAILAARLTGAPQAQYERDALDAMAELAEGGRVS